MSTHMDNKRPQPGARDAVNPMLEDDAYDEGSLPVKGGAGAKKAEVASTNPGGEGLSLDVLPDLDVDFLSSGDSGLPELPGLSPTLKDESYDEEDGLYGPITGAIKLPVLDEDELETAMREESYGPRDSLGRGGAVAHEPAAVPEYEALEEDFRRSFADESPVEDKREPREEGPYESPEASLSAEEAEERPVEQLGSSIADLASTIGQWDDDIEEDAVEPVNRAPGSSFDINMADDDGEPRFDLDDVISAAIAAGASDIHLTPGDVVAFTELREIVRHNEFGEITEFVTSRLQDQIISKQLEQDFVEELELDTSYTVKTGPAKGRRLRLSMGKTEGAIFMVFRVIADEIPTPQQLGVPEVMRGWAQLPNGLVLVNGPTGTGKSTTLASLMREIQLTRPLKVITIEKPIEYLYGTVGRASITQREVGRDARTFAAALTSAMRQAPNIILVGEVRNRLEIDELLRAAETGHLAISTLHSNSAPATINRIRSLYEGDEQLRVLSSLSDNLRGLANQVLLRHKDGGRQFAVHEVLTVDREVAAMVRVGDTDAIRDYQERKGITMEHALVRAVREGKATVETARAAAAHPLYFDEIYDS